MAKLFAKWQKGLKKSRNGLLGQLNTLLKGKESLDADVLEELEQVLIESDIGLSMAMDIIGDLESRFTAGDNVMEVAAGLLREKCMEVLRDPEETSASVQPHVTLVVGVNGTGKTTTIGKLAWHYRERGETVLLAGADTFRAAAAEQLGIWAKRAKSEIIKQPHGADPASVAYDALSAAIARKVDRLFVDTAGRLHTKTNLMEELKKISRVLKKLRENAPHEVLLVLDANTGQNGLIQARQFTEAVGVTGIVLTKLDGTARGGIAVQVQQTLGIPVKWVGIGEAIEDMLEFDVESYVAGLLQPEMP